MKLTSKQRAYLRKQAHDMDAIVRVGKDGYSESLVAGILEALVPRELMKVKILQNCEEDKVEMSHKIAEGCEAEIIGLVGRTIILFKENKDKPSFSLEIKKIR
ncbi:MAG: ribosome assembly RNA-binding protein YhbY [Fusobacteriaceae bacterium]